MEVLSQNNTAKDARPLRAANDDCARVPVMREALGYRRVALHNSKSRSQAAAVLVALLFCAWWVAVRDASGSEIAEVRQRLALEQAGPALDWFDARLADPDAPSLLRLHLMRMQAAGTQATIADSAASSSG